MVKRRPKEKYINTFLHLFYKMSERDILLDRLERKLAKKEKEVEELRKMLSFNEQKFLQFKQEIIEELKKEILDSKRIKDLESKVVELSKTVDSLTNELLYIKSELRREEVKVKADKKDKEAIKEEIIVDSSVEEESQEDENIIVCD
ncbi:hypothetical protein DRO97_05160 [Archaeoglobales archaeon]|nr:MAG: hypothetical protein DRO97_05160 [Archaeoglobales archaeon]